MKIQKIENALRKFFSYSLFIIPSFFFFLIYLVDFSQVILNDDYTDHSLGHALNLEAWSKGILQERNNYFQYFHPGIWFQLFSWISLKFSMLFNVDLKSDRLAFFKILNDSRIFFKFSGFLAATIILIFIFGFKKILKEKKMFTESLFILSLFFINQAYINYTFIKFSNEFFIIPIIFFAFYILSDLKKIERNFSSQIILGVFFAFCYLNKLPYIIVYISFISVYTGISILSHGTVGAYFRVVFVSTISMLFTSSIFLLSFFSKGIAIEIVKAHLGVFLSSGHYGSGDKNVVSIDSVISSLNFIVSSYNIFVLISVFFSLIILLLFIFKNVSFRKSIKLLSKNSIFLVSWSLVSFVLGLMAVLKHFNDHYLIMPISCLIPGVLVAFQSLEVRKRFIFLLIIFAGLSASLNKNYSDLSKSKKWYNDLSVLLKSELGNIEKKTIIYDYRFPIMEYENFFTLSVSGIPDFRKYFPEYTNTFYATAPDSLTGASRDANSDVNHIEWDYWLINDRKNDNSDSIKKILLKSDIVKKEIAHGVILVKNLKRVASF
ncbi:MAG: hypothetical protein SFU98_15070 [Leptospiraceae bacterium]|nr:hypothetical protein [Leptospiraceae bacterium]